MQGAQNLTVIFSPLETAGGWLCGKDTGKRNETGLGPMRSTIVPGRLVLAPSPGGQMDWMMLSKASKRRGCEMRHRRSKYSCRAPKGRASNSAGKDSGTPVWTSGVLSVWFLVLCA